MKKLILIWLTLFAIACNVASAQTVFITKTGKKYHTSDCRYLNESKIAIELKDAIAKGYEPCKICKPPTTIQSSLSSPSKKTNTSNNTSGIRIGCICNDGTRSSATGRGACSHHGGVNHWLYKK